MSSSCHSSCHFVCLYSPLCSRTSYVLAHWCLFIFWPPHIICHYTADYWLGMHTTAFSVCVNVRMQREDLSHFYVKMSCRESCIVWSLRDCDSFQSCCGYDRWCQKISVLINATTSVFSSYSSFTISHFSLCWTLTVPFPSSWFFSFLFYFSNPPLWKSSSHF